MVLFLFGTDYFLNKKQKNKYILAGIEKTNYTLFHDHLHRRLYVQKNTSFDMFIYSYAQSYVLRSQTGIGAR